MSDKPIREDDKRPDAESEAEARFKQIVGNLVNTPHKPHKPHQTTESSPKRESKPAERKA